MFSLIKLGAAPNEVGAGETPLNWTVPSLKYHAHDGMEISFQIIVTD